MMDGEILGAGNSLGHSHNMKGQEEGQVAQNPERENSLPGYVGRNCPFPDKEGARGIQSPDLSVFFVGVICRVAFWYTVGLLTKSCVLNNQ